MHAQMGILLFDCIYVTSSLQRVMITQFMPGGNLKNYLDATAVNTRYHNCYMLKNMHTG